MCDRHIKTLTSVVTLLKNAAEPNGLKDYTLWGRGWRSDDWGQISEREANIFVLNNGKHRVNSNNV